MSIFPTAIAGNGDLYVAVNNLATSLTAGIDASTLTIPVVSTTGFPSSGFITVDLEIIHYTSVGATQFNANLRGADGTSATSHLSAAVANLYVIAAHHNALKDEIIAIETALGTNGSLFVHISGTETIVGTKTFSNDLSILRSDAGNPVIDLISNSDNTSGTSNAKLKLSTGGSSGGDPYINFLVTGVQNFSLGIDNSDSQSFKINANADGVSSGDTAIKILSNGSVSSRGTNTNNSAAAGFVGEYIESVVSSYTNAGTSTQYKDVTSISLTAGDWDVTGQIVSYLNGATGTFFAGAISTYSGNTTTDHVDGKNVGFSMFPTASQSMISLIWRVSLTSTTTIYLKAKFTYTPGTPQYVGTIFARRMR